MPFCHQCGVDNPAAARFCDQCGAALIVVPAQPAPVAPVPAPPRPVAPAAPVAAPAPLSAGPITCAQCGTSAIPGEAFCDNCGAPLSAPQRPANPVPVPPYNAGLPPQPSYPPPQPNYPPPQPAAPSVTAPSSYIGAVPQPPSYPPPQPNYPSQPVAPARTVLAPARMAVVTGGATFPLPQLNQAVVGRADPVSKFVPDIDLTPYGALDNGVGRRHARLYVLNGQIAIEDLDSTNGTLVNGQRLVARQPRILNTGDQIQFGKLVLQIQL